LKPAGSKANRQSTHDLCLYEILTFAIFCFISALGYGSEEHGPRFVVEPPVSVFFSNATGARVECTAEGTPRPLVRWQTVLDGSTVRGVRDLMHVDDNGTLVFSPFAEHQYLPNVHSVAYRCVAHSRAGTIVSRTVQVRAGKCVTQNYIIV